MKLIAGGDMAAGDGLLEDNERQILADPTGYREQFLEQVKAQANIQADLTIGRVDTLGAAAAVAAALELPPTVASEFVAAVRGRLGGMGLEHTVRLINSFGEIAEVTSALGLPEVIPQQSELGREEPQALAASIPEASIVIEPTEKAASAPKGPKKPVVVKTRTPNTVTAKPITPQISHAAEVVLNNSEQDPEASIHPSSVTYIGAMTGRFFDASTLKQKHIDAVVGVLVGLKPALKGSDEVNIERNQFFAQVLEHRFRGSSPVTIAQLLNKKPQDISNTLFQIKDAILKSHGPKEVGEALNKLLKNDDEVTIPVPEQDEVATQAPDELSLPRVEPKSEPVVAEVLRPVPTPPVVPLRTIIDTPKKVSPEAQPSGQLIEILSKNLDLDEEGQGLVQAFFSKNRQNLSEKERTQLDHIVGKIRHRIQETHGTLMDLSFRLTNDERAMVNKTLGYVYDPERGEVIEGLCILVSEYARVDGDIDQGRIMSLERGYTKVIPKLWV